MNRLLFALGALFAFVPAPALAHGLALEMSALYSGGGETAFRGVADAGNALGEFGVSGNVTLWKRGTLRGDALAAWSMVSSSATVYSDVETDLLEHAFSAGARLRWARFSWVQPYASLRAGAAFGFFDAAGLEASDWAPRLEPALGTELVVPFSAMRSGGSNGSPSAGGFGFGVELGYRLQGDYEFHGDRPEPEDPDVAKDAIPRDGTRLGALSMSGWRLGMNLVVRF